MPSESRGRKIVGMAQPATVVIYTTPTCGYCHAAKRLLLDKGVAFDEVVAAGRHDLRAWLVQATGRRTVPQVFINGEAIGGFTELYRLEQAGRLDGKLSTPAPVDNPTLPS